MSINMQTLVRRNPGQLAVLLAACLLAVLLALPTTALALQDDATSAAAIPAKQVKGKNISPKGTVKHLCDFDITEKGLKKGVSISSYDLTGDGKADKLVLKPIGVKQSKDYVEDGKVHYSGHFTGIKATVNGKAYGTIKLGKARYAGLSLVTLKDRTVFLYLEDAYGDFYWDGGSLYYSQKGKLKSALALTSLENAGAAWIDSIKLSGKSLVVTFGGETKYLGQHSFTLKYNVSKGKLVQASEKPLEWGYYEEKYKLGHWTCPAAKSFKVYKDEKLKKVAFTVAKGQKVKATSALVKNGKLFLKIKCGNKTGWVKDGVLKDEPLFEYCHEFARE